jgi:hypothetical protein
VNGRDAEHDEDKDQRHVNCASMPARWPVFFRVRCHFFQSLYCVPIKNEKARPGVIASESGSMVPQVFHCPLRKTERLREFPQSDSASTTASSIGIKHGFVNTFGLFSLFGLFRLFRPGRRSIRSISFISLISFISTGRRAAGTDSGKVARVTRRASGFRRRASG